jgi:hypothetical protein
MPDLHDGVGKWEVAKATTTVEETRQASDRAAAQVEKRRIEPTLG